MAKGVGHRKGGRKRRNGPARWAHDVSTSQSSSKLQYPPAPAPRQAEVLTLLSQASPPHEEAAPDSFQEPEAAGSCASPPAAAPYLVEGQVLLGLALALFAEPVQTLLPWGPNASGIIATALFLGSMALMFQPAAALADDIRRQAPGLGARLERAAGSMCLGGGLALALVSAAASGAGQDVTAENVRQMVLEWSDRSGLGAQPEGPDPAHYFSYSIALKSGFPLTVQRTKARADALTFASTLRLSGEHRLGFSGMSGGQQESFLKTLAKELDGPGVEFRLEMPDAVQIRGTVPLGDLSRATFHQTILDMDAALSRVKAAIQRQAGG